ncbi:MAG: methyltransferase [Bacteroidetes bacterium]|nr:MAG: methyltransferase [Bacteroidota bacterium]
MKAVLKYFVSNTYKPMLVRYLARPRTYSYKGIQVAVYPGVFHPGFFFSTKILLNQIKRLDLQDRNFLELGAGTGLISIVATKLGANVTATDINPEAIQCLRKNRECNNVNFTVIRSDLFASVPPQEFDVIAINPPYYKRNPANSAEYAWCCGENGEYFQNFFGEVGKFCRPDSIILMVLCDGCDIDMILHMAKIKGFRFECLERRQNLLEKNFVFQFFKAS